MRLSKQERIGVLIILVVVIIALGVFLFIVPAAQTIEATLKNLSNKESEYQAALDKQALKEPLRTQIIEAYKDGEHVADMFFPEMKSYEADVAAREFLLQCEANIVVTSLSVSQPGTSTLSTNFPVESEVTYSLKQNVKQGVSPDEAAVKRQARLAALQAALGSAQTIGSSIVNFTVKAENQDELTKFIDEINNYVRNENGVETRKALMLANGYSITYGDVTEKYTKYSDLIKEEVDKAGQAAIDAGAGEEFTYEVPEIDLNPDDEEDEELNISDTMKTMTVNLIFYSIERMQDPEPQLDAQDGITANSGSEEAA
ncbi:MAG: hypothetical protein J1F03_05140 [Oscillospiraceae bacterium]|nr:hypothetical protein [Oscillospiraceae bacterium]